MPQPPTSAPDGYGVACRTIGKVGAGLRTAPQYRRGLPCTVLVLVQGFRLRRSGLRRDEANRRQTSPWLQSKPQIKQMNADDFILKDEGYAILFQHPSISPYPSPICDNLPNLRFRFSSTSPPQARSRPPVDIAGPWHHRERLGFLAWRVWNAVTWPWPRWSGCTGSFFKFKCC